MIVKYFFEDYSDDNKLAVVLVVTRERDDLVALKEAADLEKAFARYKMIPFHAHVCFLAFLELTGGLAEHITVFLPAPSPVSLPSQVLMELQCSEWG